MYVQYNNCGDGGINHPVLNRWEDYSKSVGRQVWQAVEECVSRIRIRVLTIIQGWITGSDAYSVCSLLSGSAGHWCTNVWILAHIHIPICIAFLISFAISLCFVRQTSEKRDNYITAWVSSGYRLPSPSCLTCYSSGQDHSSLLWDKLGQESNILQKKRKHQDTK